MKALKVKLTFTEPILGTSPANPEIYRELTGRSVDYLLSLTS